MAGKSPAERAGGREARVRAKGSGKARRKRGRLTSAYLATLVSSFLQRAFPMAPISCLRLSLLLLILLFLLLLRWGMKVANEAKGRFERLAAAGMTATIFFYTAINLLMVMGLAPVVGIPLPLVSYGGSAMMTVMICLGVLMSIDRATRKDARRGRL